MKPKNDETLDLQPGDLVLMHYQGNGPEGQVFQFVDKAGKLDGVDESDESIPLNGQPGNNSVEVNSMKSPGESCLLSAGPESVIQTLERQREVLDRTITELRRISPPNLDPPISVEGNNAGSSDMPSTKEGSAPVQPRRLWVSGNRGSSSR